MKRLGMGTLRVAAMLLAVLLLVVGLEFFYYWFHRASHTVRWFWSSHSVHHSPNQFNFAIERELDKATSINIAYVGQRGEHAVADAHVCERHRIDGGRFGIIEGNGQETDFLTHSAR